MLKFMAYCCSTLAGLIVVGVEMRILSVVNVVGAENRSKKAIFPIFF